MQQFPGSRHGPPTVSACIEPRAYFGPMTLLALNKPYNTMSQFSPHPTRPTLAECVAVPGVYPAGRLDADSEGLLLLTDDGALQARIADPQHKLVKTYLAQVEGVPDEAALQALRAGLDLGDFRTLPAQARPVDTPDTLWPRDPPIRYRAAIPTTWVELRIREGKNRRATDDRSRRTPDAAPGTHGDRWPRPVHARADARRMAGNHTGSARPVRPRQPRAAGSRAGGEAQGLQTLTNAGKIPVSLRQPIAWWPRC